MRQASGFFSTFVFSCAAAGGGRTVEGGDTRIIMPHRSTEHPVIHLKVVLPLLFCLTKIISQGVFSAYDQLSGIKKKLLTNKSECSTLCG